MWHSDIFFYHPVILSFPRKPPVHLSRIPSELNIETNEQEEQRQRFCGPNVQDTQEGIGSVNEKLWHKLLACSTLMLFCSFK